ncbi:hypothetical protein [Aurantimonas sp. Leaf443]|uniref:hypothetical protein n=1 Tax=Aurantimonas sp. Leaf443 TaxID=1736378 RepID=UPI0006F25682|nr:hypothetical protein [Aurantimonas sp. Leaf443]KQT85995.1 hypothetical protein ASG48_05235 [Aurantimonas sp. Leaf443]
MVEVGSRKIAAERPNISSVASWRAAKNAPHYRQEAALQARSAAIADVEDRVLEWCAGVAAESWDDL